MCIPHLPRQLYNGPDPACGLESAVAACHAQPAAPGLPLALTASAHPVLGQLGLGEDLGDLDAGLHIQLAHLSGRHARPVGQRLPAGHHAGGHIAQVAAVKQAGELPCEMNKAEECCKEQEPGAAGCWRRATSAAAAARWRRRRRRLTAPRRRRAANGKGKREEMREHRSGAAVHSGPPVVMARRSTQAAPQPRSPRAQRLGARLRGAAA